jgi:chromosome condensin MukBEF MukE localization factor
VGSDPAFRIERVINVFEFGDGTFDVTSTRLGRSADEPRQGQGRRLRAGEASVLVGRLLLESERATARTAQEHDQQHDEQQQHDGVPEDPAREDGDHQDHQDQFE